MKALSDVLCDTQENPVLPPAWSVTVVTSAMPGVSKNRKHCTPSNCRSTADSQRIPFYNGDKKVSWFNKKNLIILVIHDFVSFDWHANSQLVNVGVFYLWNKLFLVPEIKLNKVPCGHVYISTEMLARHQHRVLWLIIKYFN